MTTFVFLLIFVFNQTPATEAGESSNVEATELSRAISTATDGEYQQALAIFERLLRQTPEDVQLLYYVGMCHFFLNHSEEAEEFLAQAVEKRPEFPEAYLWYAEVLARADRRPVALEVARQGLHRFPQNKKLIALEKKLENGG